MRRSRRGFLAGAASLGALLPAARVAAQTSPPPPAGSIVDVGGIRVGHFTDPRRPTGCTVLLFDRPATAGVDYDGAAPGESLGVLLQPVSPLNQIHGIFLAGGGPMALGASAGVVRFLEERQIGYDWGVPNVRIPIVPSAIIDDLAIGDGRIRIGPDEAYRACEAASAAAPAEGSVGAGTGATVGKMFVGRGLGGMKGGLATASVRHGGVVIGALVVLNAAGDVVDWRRGAIAAGARTKDGRAFASSVDVLRADLDRRGAQASVIADDPLRATTLTVVATNVALSKTELTKLAMMANTGAARAINPYHTQGDGDQLFAVSTGTLTLNLSLTTVGAIAADLVADTIVRAARVATGLPGWPAVRDL
jgi:L-aminopeptidase/D-esterase-like protein